MIVNNCVSNISNAGAIRLNSKNMCVDNAESVVSSVYCSNGADNFTLVNKKKKKILQAINVDIKSLNQHLKNKNFSNYTIKQNSITAPVKIAITDESDVPKIKDELIKSQISFHEFKWEAEKSKAFIIRGLVNAVDADLTYIKSELVAAGLPNNIGLSLFKSGYMRANHKKEHNSLVQLILPPNSDTKILFDIKFLDHVATKFEPLKNSRMLQCKNCQRFGHSASGCQHKHRGVKCGDDHYKENCPRTSNKNVKLVCCNCLGEHTANNILECPVAQKFVNQSYNNNKNNLSNSSNNISSNSNNASFLSNAVGNQQTRAKLVTNIKAGNSQIINNRNSSSVNNHSNSKQRSVLANNNNGNLGSNSNNSHDYLNLLHFTQNSNNSRSKYRSNAFQHTNTKVLPSYAQVVGNGPGQTLHSAADQMEIIGKLD